MPKTSALKKLILRIRRKISRLGPKEPWNGADTQTTRDYLAKSFCYNPFTQMDVYESGKVYSCCSSWLPTAIGNIRSEKVEALWNSPFSQSIRESIHDGSFSYCNHRICPAIQSRTLPSLEEARNNPLFANIIATKEVKLAEPPAFINLCNDTSCNLACPSCRVEKIIYANGPQYEERKHLQDLITDQLFLKGTERHFTVNITGSGDPFASAVFREFLYNLNGEDFPNLKIHLQTNGVLLTPSNWEKMKRIHKNIKVILISFDAATEATYKITRKGGHWPTLLKNVERLGELRRLNLLNFLRLDFVVQKANYREMARFAELGKHFNADQVTFSMLLNWGTWSDAAYANNCVWRETHTEYRNFLEVLKAPILADPIVYLGNLASFRQLALHNG